MVEIRNYNSDDYEQVADLYKQSDLYGGEFDNARDSKNRLQELTKNKPDSILVAELNNEIMGTVTLFEHGRSAWLYRFAVKNGQHEDMTTVELWNNAKEILKQKGHTQVLVYAPVGEKKFEDRYTRLDFKKGNEFTAFWQDIV